MSHANGFLDLVNAARGRIREIDASELPAALRDDPTAAVIDVREDREYAAGHVAGAEHIGKGVIERDIESAHPDKSQTLYLYCGGGFRSALAADALRQMGYTDPVSVDGGWRVLQGVMDVETVAP